MHKKVIDFIKVNLLLISILTGGTLLRLYKINLPLLDTKPHREIFTAEITRNLYYDNFNLLYTKLKLGGGTEYCLVEFPVYNLLAAIPYQFTHQVNEVWGKLISVFSSLGLALFLYLLVKNIFNKNIALSTIFFYYIISPQSVILARSFQPDQLGLFFSILSLYHFNKWINSTKIINYLITYFSLLLMFLIKINFFPVLFPMLYLAFNKYKFKMISNIYLLFLITSIIPEIIWIIHLKNVYIHYPSSAFPSFSGYRDLLNPWLNLSNFFNLKWYVNVFFDFINQILTLPLFLLFIIGLFNKKKLKNINIVYYWMIGLILYIIIFSNNISYWYYQVTLIFPFIIIAAVAFEKMLTNIKNITPYPKLLLFILVIFTIILTGRPYYLRTYQTDQKHKYVLEVAEIIKRIAPSNGKTIGSSYNSAALTYYSLRKDMIGASIYLDDVSCQNDCILSKLADYKIWGASYYAVSDIFEFKGKELLLDKIKNKYKIYKENDNYLIFQM